MARCVVIGASGYTGKELVEILLRHPSAELVGVFGSSARVTSTALCDEFPTFRGRCELDIEPYSFGAVSALSPDAVFLATPHEVSARVAPELLGLSPVFDLSGGFRLDAGDYPAYYGFEHPSLELLTDAVYGLVEHNRSAIAEGDLIAVPGCYATAAILALKPISSLIKPGTTPVVDAISGVSGAGRGAKKDNLFGEVSLKPYGVFTHRHTPEIVKYGGAPVVFTPHVAPYFRGIIATVHAELADTAVAGAYESAYSNETFVRLLPSGTWPSVGGVEHTNFADLAWAVQGNHLVACVAIDNLVKGAAGQGVQCMNVRLGFAESAGLLPDSTCVAGVVGVVGGVA